MGIVYRNDNDEIVSKEEYESELAKFQINVDAQYNIIVNELLKEINNNAHSDKEKLWMLYDYLTSENMSYDLTVHPTDTRSATPQRYSFRNYKKLSIAQDSKYPAILNNSGVCITYSLAFEDLANRLSIPCRVVKGYTGMDHAWNVVLIDNEVKQIDVSYAIMNRKISDKKDFFLKNSFNGRTITSSISDLERDMRKQQYLREHPQIVINSRTDDGEEEPRITIHKK